MTRDEYLRNISRVADDLREAVDRKNAESLAAETGFEQRVIMEAIRIVRRDKVTVEQRSRFVAANDE